MTLISLYQTPRRKRERERERDIYTNLSVRVSRLRAHFRTLRFQKRHVLPRFSRFLRHFANFCENFQIFRNLLNNFAKNDTKASKKSFKSSRIYGRPRFVWLLCFRSVLIFCLYFFLTSGMFSGFEALKHENLLSDSCAWSFRVVITF